MNRLKTRAWRSRILKTAAMVTSTRGRGKSGTARARRASEADMNTGLRLGEGLSVVSGRMEVPIGKGLEVDARGKLGAVASRAQNFLLAFQDNDQLTVEGSYQALDIGGTGFVTQEFGQSGVTAVTSDNYFRLQFGGVYLFSVDSSFYRDQSNSGHVQYARPKIQRLDDLDGAMTESDLLEGIGQSLKSVNQGEPHFSTSLKAIVDLRSDLEDAGVRLAVKTSTNSSVYDPTYARNTTMKIERLT